MSKGIIFSGIQPTGSLHLGNYLGAIRNWVGLQDDYTCIFGIMDLHAITVPQDAQKLRASVLETAAALIACGINPDKSIIMVQSAVHGHTDLAWLLGCMTPLGWLNRMTQFKEKAGKDKENASLGLYGYPVLQAADILLYKATHVPVGEDQKQHIELARDIAGAFNRRAGRDFFPLPEPVIMPEGARIMSLRDGTKKMSKSDASDYSRINLTDTAEDIALKFQKAKSDSMDGISYNVSERPECSNLIDIYAILSGISRQQVCNEFAGRNFSTFKKELAVLAAEKIGNITTKYNHLLGNVTELKAIISAGNARASGIAEVVLKDARKISGFD